jgi:phosphopantothenoylcysteine decarboxylase/phosphopantothenate--cysteine ligase
MYQAVMSLAETHDIYIGAAAVADYSPAAVAPQKIKKQEEQSTLTLTRTKDILAAVAALTKHPFTVGFAAETHDLENYAKNKLQQKRLDMIAANWVGGEQGGFESDQNALEVFWASGHESLAMTDKSELAQHLIELIARQIKPLAFSV